MNFRHVCTALLISLGFAGLAAADVVPLSELGIEGIVQDWGKPHLNLSMGGKPLTIGGVHYATGIGTHACSAIWIDTKGHADHFKAMVGADEDVNATPFRKNHPILFQVVGDGKILFDSGSMRDGDPAMPVDIDLTGVKTLVLTTLPVDAIDLGHADWVDGSLTYSGEKPVAVAPPVEPKEVLTPKPPATPRINSARVFGVRPTHPLLFTIAATGDRPMTFSAEGLPSGITLDAQTGQLSGTVASAGEFVVKLKATNALGSAQGQLKIAVGNTIALTPPMGWNSWNCFGGAVSEEKVRAAADAMVSSGLINHGWTYINVDDGWQASGRETDDHRRAPDGHIMTNKKFPDMKAMADYIHSKGLRAGLYSSPGPETCGHFTASYQHEQDDANQYAAWGYDYLKYDWCSYDTIEKQIKSAANPPSQLEIYQHPYRIMSDALLKQNRDIVFSFCQYGMGDVWEWGEQFGGNSWRTTGDLYDHWGRPGGPRVYPKRSRKICRPRSLERSGYAGGRHGRLGIPSASNQPDSQ